MAFVELVVLAQPRRDDFLQVKSHGQCSAIWASNATLRPPIPVGVERAQAQTCFAPAVPFQLHIKPLKPFPAFLRSAPRSIVHHIALHLPPRPAYDSAH